MSVDIVIYHNPECGTSRNALAMVRNAGIEPHVIEYLKTPPNRPRLISLIARMGITPRELLREKGTPFGELGLGDPTLSDEQLIDAMRHRQVADLRGRQFRGAKQPAGKECRQQEC